jgi:signal peptidase I
MAAPRFVPWRPGDRAYLPLLGALVTILVTLLVVLYGLNTVIRVDGDSMYPALHDEDRILVTRGYDEPRRGDIVTLVEPMGGEGDGLIKRIIAIGGDTVTIEGDVAYVNGVRSAVAPEAVIGPDTRGFAPVEVPEGWVYLMGDNRPTSLDSRHFGIVPDVALRGRVIAVISPVTRFRLMD